MSDNDKSSGRQATPTQDQAIAACRRQPEHGINLANERQGRHFAEVDRDPAPPRPSR